MPPVVAPADRQDSPYRWVILAMVTLSGFLVMGFPTTGLSALFSEIAASLDLDLVEIGVVWGVGSLMGIFTALIGGTLIDQFGTRRTLVVLCLATGLSGALRGMAFDFWSLFFSSFFFGMVQPILPMNFVKLNREWFRSRQLGFASGVMSAGFATGLMLGSRMSATVLSPLLGGWRAVLIFLGLCAIVLAVLWALVHPPVERRAGGRPALGKIIGNYRYVSRFRELWVIALAVFGVLGLMRGLSGYVPTYLREIGWDPVSADTAITIFFFSSLIGVVPISHLSDRLGNRRLVMAFGTTMMAIGCALMYFVGDSFWGVMLAMVIGGFCFDSFMALKGAATTEVEGLELALVGSALGFVGMLQNIGASFVPPLGNALSTVALNVPFLLWAGSGLFATAVLLSYRRRKVK
ncbi:MAG: MFS transporter [Chloroflexota bacterium]|nr:MFS transporter [Chloroflexota bacterium]MDE2856039.1 MFS transporter [Chloroflexota bacterium]MDE2946469.1 MFS transporter [Chloroflexota bacterium]